MSGITPLHWKKFEKFLLFIGCSFVREKGDHRIYKRDGLKRPVVVPRDSDLLIFIIRNNLHIIGITPQEYLEILENL